ncbi:type II toxin-antitoxin system RelE/ParE family toxin [Dyadobacter aurulentus]|uniref:type II toxin-antitoxin system RelE/ParE family toxin n=1 Tax=Dyadobacter sp. UC 10 TaxID=2605428 RepID=UPI0011F23FA8|nr:type II toxin-antitoxin system RelE/ParE family toxin [Dyadobacter sp. UC 10]KAA0988978.1 type II toxin-antitoxin system RelE/ParE family toxin [Dyadobacter sp. UC 10]
MAGIIWSKEARQDLDNIFLWLENESKSYSRRWINEVFKKVDLLEKFPDMGRQIPETRIESIREIRAGNYRVIYNARKNGMEILAIRHSSRPLSEY